VAWRRSDGGSDEKLCACVGSNTASRNSGPIAGTRPVPPHTMILPPGFELVAAYAVAAFFFDLAYHHRVPPVQLVLLLATYGALLELGQLWVPGRHGQLSDIGADLANSVIPSIFRSGRARYNSGLRQPLIQPLLPRPVKRSCDDADCSKGSWATRHGEDLIAVAAVFPGAYRDPEFLLVRRRFHRFCPPNKSTAAR
jgi:hypothetical protein